MVKHEFYMYFYEEDKQVSYPLTTAQMSLVGTFELDENSEDYNLKLVNEFNSLLPKFLRDHDMHMFIPLKNPSIDQQEGVVSICYYHNGAMYKKVFELFPEYICMPDEITMDKLEQLYANHGLEGWCDARINLTLEEDQTTQV